MDREKELELFLLKTDELIESKYIVADIKIVGVLKAIAASETLVAIFKNCLTGFDYAAAKKKYLVKSKYLAEDKGEFILPQSSRELLAFIFNILLDIDAHRIDFAEFINKYFYEDGSFSLGYASFINATIKPFKNSVKVLMESVIEGKLQDPVEAVIEQERRLEEEKIQEETQKQKEKELAEKSYGESVKAIKEILLGDKTRVKESRLKEDDKEEAILLIDAFANALMCGDKDAVIYSYVAYKYLVKRRKLLFLGRLKKINGYMADVLNGI